MILIITLLIHKFNQEILRGTFKIILLSSGEIIYFYKISANELKEED